jgi:hypothetical protein
MNEREFKAKLESYQTSNAPVELKEKKIKELEEEFYGKQTNALVDNGEIDANELYEGD